MPRRYGAGILKTNRAPKKQMTALVLEPLQTLSRSVQQFAACIYQRQVNINEHVSIFHGLAKWPDSHCERRKQRLFRMVAFELPSLSPLSSIKRFGPHVSSRWFLECATNRQTSSG